MLSFLRELLQVHYLIDEPTRISKSDEQLLVFRLRKICLHVPAIVRWEISVGVEHVMASDLRAAYRQMDWVWRRLPDEHQIMEIADAWWENEARNGLLATNDRPTPQSLLHGAGYGGFSDGEEIQSYGRLTLWLSRLRCSRFLST